MLEFHHPTPEDGSWVRELLLASQFNNSEYSFGSTYIWRRLLKKRIARYKDFYLAQSVIKGKTAYLFPAGRGDWREGIELYREDAKQHGAPLMLYSVTPAMQALLLEAYPQEKIAFKPVRYAYDYVYNASDLIDLAGRKYHGKRNHIARFKQNHPDWHFENITSQNIAACEAMFYEWLTHTEDPAAYNDERDAILDAFAHFETLNFMGGLIRSGGRVVAFTMGESLTNDCFVLHFEKAFADLQGAYPIINREFAARRLVGYQYINREEDMDLPGLRKSKESYSPAFLAEKSIAIWDETP